MASSHPQSRSARLRRAFGVVRTGASSGFTLIELLVVTGIIVVVSTVVLADNNRFGGRVQLENLAYDIALSIRQAQVYGISVERFRTGTFSSGYGIHFDLANPNTYGLFADAITQNGLYDCPSPGTDDCELVQTTNITAGYQIQDLCVTSSVGGETCGIPSIDIVFERPEPDAWIGSSGVSCILDAGACAEGARVQIVSPRGDTMNVAVEANGQISVRH